MTKEQQMPERRMVGSSEIWRDDSTGTRDFYILFVRVRRSHFTHSTWADTFEVQPRGQCV